MPPNLRPLSTLPSRIRPYLIRTATKHLSRRLLTTPLPPAVVMGNRCGVF